MAAPLHEVITILLDSHKNNSKAKGKGGVTKIPMGDVAVAMLNCIECMHNNGNLFNDVKPENFMLAEPSSTRGATSKSKKSSSDVSQRVRLIDFGLIERYGDMSTSKIRENAFPDAPLVGTPTYASLFVHSGNTASRRDDLEALGYVIAELILMLVGSGGENGSTTNKKGKKKKILPWEHATSDEELFKIKLREMDKSKRKKSKLFASLKAGKTDTVMDNYFDTVGNLSYSERPNYDVLRSHLKKLVVTLESGGSSGANKKELASTASPKKKVTAKSRHVGVKQFPSSQGDKFSGPRDSSLPPLERHPSTGRNSGSDSEDPSDAEDDDSEVDRRNVGGRQFPSSRGVKFSGPRDSLLPPHMSSHHSLSNDVGYDSDSDIDEMKNNRMPMPSSSCPPCRQSSDSIDNESKSGSDGQTHVPSSCQDEGVSNLQSNTANNTNQNDIPTVATILAFGLEAVGFGQKRQQVQMKLNMTRFKAHYGVGPRTIQALYKDLKEKYKSTELKPCMITLNWFKVRVKMTLVHLYFILQQLMPVQLYATEPVLAGVWGYCEPKVSKIVNDYAKRIQSLKEKKIVFGGWGEDEVHIISVDGVNFTTQEFRLDPSSKWCVLFSLITLLLFDYSPDHIFVCY